MDWVINNIGDRESREGKDNYRDFELEKMNREGLILLDMGKLGEEIGGRNFRVD